MRTGSKALGTVAALFYILLWASAYVPSKIGAVDSSPLWFLVVRFFAAGAILVVLALATHGEFPATPRALGLVVILGILSNAAYLGFTYEALRHLASGIGAIVASTNPLLLALVAPFVLREPLRPIKVAGLLLGFAGVVGIMIARAGTGTALPLDVGLATLGVVANVAGTIVFKRWCASADLVPLTAIQLLAASLVLLPLALVFEGAPHVAPDEGPRVAVSFIYLVCVLSVGASLLWFWLLRHGEASRVSAYYFLTPVFGLALSALLLGERVSVRDLGGLAAIAVGIVLVQRG